MLIMAFSACCEYTWEHMIYMKTGKCIMLLEVNHLCACVYVRVCVCVCVCLLLLLLSRFSRVWLCVTPKMAAHQAPPSLGFSRQEYWSGLPFPSIHESETWKWSRSVVSDSSRPHGLKGQSLLLIKRCYLFNLEYFTWDLPFKQIFILYIYFLAMPRGM